MPAHFTHLIFAEEALLAALGSTGEGVLKSFGNLFRFGAQGPDFFYHNQRTRRLLTMSTSIIRSRKG